MKLIPLYGVNGVGKFAQVDDEDYDFLMKWRWYAVYMKVSSNYYIVCNYNLGSGKWTNKRIHFLIMGKKEGMVIDHIDGDTFNNQRSNLRFCTFGENCYSRVKYKNGSSEYKGVTLKNGRKEHHVKYWVARIQVNKIAIDLGKFPHTEEGKKLAALAYNEAAIKYYGPFAKTNNINGENRKNLNPITNTSKKEREALEYKGLLPLKSKAIQLTKGQFAIVDEEDYEYLNKWKWQFNSTYALKHEKRIPNKIRPTTFMHKLIVSAPKGQIVDHINGNPLDNRKCNLRFAEPYQSSANTKLRVNKKSSKYYGVYVHQNIIYSTIKVQGKETKIGRWPYSPENEIIAAKEYDKMAQKLRGEFAKLNFNP